MYEVFFKFYSCNEDIKPLSAFPCRHVKYKIHAPECTKIRHFYFKNSKIFWGGGVWEGAACPPPSAPAAPRSSRLRRSLTHPPYSEVWLLACISAAYAVMRCPSVCLSVCLTFVDSVETNKHTGIFNLFPPLGSHAL